jgi:hypothetical protein
MSMPAEHKELMERMIAAQEEANARTARFEEREQARATEENARAEKLRAESVKHNEKIAADRERMLVAGERQAAALEKIAELLHAWDVDGIPSRGGP